MCGSWLIWTVCPNRLGQRSILTCLWQLVNLDSVSYQLSHATLFNLRPISWLIWTVCSATSLTSTVNEWGHIDNKQGRVSLIVITKNARYGMRIMKIPQHIVSDFCNEFLMRCKSVANGASLVFATIVNLA